MGKNSVVISIFTKLILLIYLICVIYDLIKGNKIDVNGLAYMYGLATLNVIFFME